MPDCIFCKIVKGEIPSAKIFENESVLAFLDIGPLAPGHVLVIPKKHAVTVDEMTGDDMAEVGRVLPRIAKAVLAATGAAGYNLYQCNGAASGQEVMHVHVHIIPRNPDDGLGYRWKAGKYAGEEMKRWREKIAAAMS
jgi:histidine triad (HIT) family protein